MRAWAFLLTLLPLIVSAQQDRPYTVPPPAERVQVHGTVTDAVTGRPVYECLVEHYDLQDKRWSVTMVNSEGRYALFVPAGQPFRLRVTRENGYAPLDKAIPALPAGRAFEQALRLRPLN